MAMGGAQNGWTIRSPRRLIPYTLLDDPAIGHQRDSRGAGHGGGGHKHQRRNWMFRQRLAAVTSAVVLALGGTVIAATPAQAADTNCQTWVGASYQAGVYVSGYKFKECVNGTEIPL